MFANVEEAEKAAAMLRRFGGKECEAYQSRQGYFGIRGPHIDPATPLTGWDEVADFLLAQQDPPQEGRRAGQLAQARANLRIGQSHLDLSTRLSSVLATLECLLEVLA